MATTTETTSTPTSTANYSGTAMDIATLNALVSSMFAGKTITASDVNKLIAAYNAFVAHTHTVTDIGYLKYGNSYAHDSTSYLNTTGTAANSAGSAFAATNMSFATGETIIASKINSLIALINSIRTHRHGITDNLD